MEILEGILAVVGGVAVLLIVLTTCWEIKNWFERISATWAGLIADRNNNVNRIERLERDLRSAEVAIGCVSENLREALKAKKTK